MAKKLILAGIDSKGVATFEIDEKLYTIGCGDSLDLTTDPPKHETLAEFKKKMGSASE